MQIHEVNLKTTVFKELVVCLAYLWSCTEFTHCTHDLLLHLKHSCITKVPLKCDLCSKAQHLQRDVRLEVQHLMMLCIRSVGLLVSFVVLFFLRSS